MEPNVIFQINLMVSEGTAGTKDGDGLAQTINRANISTLPSG